MQFSLRGGDMCPLINDWGWCKNCNAKQAFSTSLFFYFKQEVQPDISSIPSISVNPKFGVNQIIVCARTSLGISGIRLHIHLVHYLKKRDNTRNTHNSRIYPSIIKVPGNTSSNITTLPPDLNPPATWIFVQYLTRTHPTLKKKPACWALPRKLLFHIEFFLVFR